VAYAYLVIVRHQQRREPHRRARRTRHHAPRSWWPWPWACFAYATGNIRFAGYLQIPYIHGVGELLIFSSTLTGRASGFSG